MHSFELTDKLNKNKNNSQNYPGTNGHSMNGISDQAHISIIIPAYEEEKIIEKHISIFTSEILKKHNIELIVSDGGSADATVEIAKKYTDKIVVHNEAARQRIGEGRNKGAEIAKGDTLVFLNADTMPENIDKFLEVITKFHSKAGKYAKVDALACKVTAFPEELLFKDKIFYAIHNSYVHLLNIIGLGMGRGECQVIRSAVFSREHGYNPSIAAGEDFDLYRRISLKGKVLYDPDLSVLESPRRFRKYGYLKTICIWLLNSLSVWFFGKSLSKEWEPIR